LNKKLQKGLVAAVAATLSTGIVAPVYAASVETKSFDAQYAEAYNATVNAKTQKELTAARVLVDKLYADLPQDLKNLAATLSAILDPKQQTELVNLDKAIKAAEALGTQANVNAARALIVDMPIVWKNSFSSYIDKIQQALVVKAVDAVKKAQVSGSQADFDAAEALYTELLTVTNNDGVKSWAEVALKAELDKVVVVLSVESITALNNKQVAIVFNQEVDSTDAENKAFYTRAGVALASGDLVELQEDGKTVVITLAGSETNQTKIKYAVAKNLRTADLALKLAAKVEQEVTFADLAVPTVVKVEQNGPKGVKVYFNEPVTNVSSSAFSVDGGKYYASVGTIDNQRYSVELNFGTVLTEGEHTLVINKTNVVKDAAGLYVAETTMNFGMVKDAVLPTIVDAEAKSQTKVVLTFSKSLDATYAATTVLSNYYHSATNYTPTSIRFVPGSNNTQLELTFTGNPLPAGNVSLNIKKEVVKDLFGNKNVAGSTTVAVSVDSTKPEVTGLNVKTDKKLEVLFSESVVGSTVASNYVLKNSAGEVIKSKSYANSVGNPIGTYTYNSTEKKVTLDLAASLPAGSYSLEVSGVKDGALVANIMEATTLNFTVTDTTAPTVTGTGDLIAAVSPAGQKVVVRFSESMKVEGEGSILDPNNYYVGGAVLDTDSTLVAGNDNMSVIITLPTTTVVTSGLAGNVTVGRVADASGNYTAALSTPVTVSNSGNVLVVSGSAETTSTTSVQFEVSYPLASIDANKFTVNGDTVVAASFENKILADGVTSGAVITLSVADADKWATNATPTIAVTAAGSAKDSHGRDLLVATTATTDGTAPEYAVNPAGDNLIEIKDNDRDGKIDQVVITYTEALKADTLSIAAYEVAGYTVSGMSYTAGTNVVTLSLTEKSVADTAAVPTVRQVLAIKDVAGNAKAVEETANDSLDVAKAYIKNTAVDTTTNTITLVFSEDMDITTLDTAAEITIGSTKTLGTAPTFTWSEDNKTLTIVGGAGFNVATADVITAISATDEAGNAVDLTSIAADADLTF
jgi:trimeric autotransporter adhesin